MLKRKEKQEYARKSDGGREIEDDKAETDRETEKERGTEEEERIISKTQPDACGYTLTSS